MLQLDAAQPVCLAARKDDDDWHWHERFSHLHFEVLRQLGQQSMMRGLPIIKHVEQVCDTCVITKQRCYTFPLQALYRAEKPLELVRSDLCGPMMPRP